MSRLPYLRRDDLTADGQAVWDAVAAIPGVGALTQQGWLPGPFNAAVHAPDTGKALLALARTLQVGTSIDRRLTEIAILTVGARWHAEFEWWAHSRLARNHGVPDTVIDAIARGEDPPFAADDERIVHAVASQLARAGQVDTDAYLAARELLGDTGLVELVALCGYYTLVSFLLNAFDVSVPPGEVPRWGTSNPEGASRAGTA